VGTTLESQSPRPFEPIDDIANRGGDADTTAAIAGQFAGARLKTLRLGSCKADGPAPEMAAQHDVIRRRADGRLKRAGPG
jgi:hypothetical protein